jgi:hypothetical protein
MAALWEAVMFTSTFTPEPRQRSQPPVNPLIYWPGGKQQTSKINAIIWAACSKTDSGIVESRESAHHLRRTPGTTTHSRDAALVEALCKGPQ